MESKSGGSHGVSNGENNAITRGAVVNSDVTVIADDTLKLKVLGRKQP